MITLTLVVHLHEKSRGVIELASASPNDLPIIKPNYFNVEEDMEAMVRMVKLQVSYLNTTAYSNMGGEVVKFSIADCDQFEFESDEYWACYVRYFTFTDYHPVGTSRMGPNTDSDAVVDSELNVKNIKNLREIDAGM